MERSAVPPEPQSGAPNLTEAFGTLQGSAMCGPAPTLPPNA
jgi:hypothetical protein